MKKYISIIFLTLAITGSSCKKDFLSLETNLNTPSAASPDLLLSGALKSSASIVNGTGYTMYANWVGYLAWSTGYQANTTLEQYLLTTSSYDLFTPLYLNISNYSALIKSNPGPFYTGIAKIMTVYDFEQLVDNYGNVPYKQALLGTSNLNPTYDDASAIYDDLMVQLDASISLIQQGIKAGVIPPTGDIMFKGTMANWVLFANTLKLKLALRESSNPTISSKASALKAAAAATASLGYLGVVGATLNPGYINSDASGGQQSPIILAYGLNAAGGSSGVNATYQANSYAAHFYGKNNDPRLDQVYSATSTAGAGAAAGVLNGTVDSVASNPSYVVVASPFGSSTSPNAIVPPSKSRANISPSKFGPGVLKSQTQNAVIMSSAEAYFLQAEAAAAGGYGISGSPASFYNAGITASFVDDLVPNAATAAQTYYSQPAIAYPTGSFAVQQQAIITQKWAALNLYGAFEAFNELRRTGYPNDIPLSIYPGANAPNQVARIPYPFVEYATNAANVPNANNVNIFTSKIFWAK